ncbi:H-NS histone family protein [uncultured Roseobacter sp.]|uniref:H-NS histone family protein n=1 Tax=uncultured Roseobacter sp. TaxID=114847 RepID=UPI0026366F2C|nr:H-NS histone family protein [uncultured Roseobacter sp.]
MAPKAISKTTAKPAAKAAPKLATNSKLVSKAKYENPDNPKQTWSGMGRKPAWFIAHLEAGKKLEGLTA